MPSNVEENLAEPTPNENHRGSPGTPANAPSRKQPIERSLTPDSSMIRPAKRRRLGARQTEHAHPATRSLGVEEAELAADTKKSSDMQARKTPSRASAAARNVIDVDALDEEHASKVLKPNHAARSSLKTERGHQNPILVRGRYAVSQGSKANPIDVDEAASSGWKKILAPPAVTKTRKLKRPKPVAKTNFGQEFWFGGSKPAQGRLIKCNPSVEAAPDSSEEMVLAADLGLIGPDGALDLSSGKASSTSSSSGSKREGENLTITEPFQKPDILRGLKSRDATRSRGGRSD